MKLIEQLFDLMLGFTLARARSLVGFLIIAAAVAWLIDWRMSFSTFSRLERAVTLTERLDALDRRGPATKDIAELRSALAAELKRVSAPALGYQAAGAPTESTWFSTRWMKGLAGLLPWLILSALGASALSKVQKDAWAGFVVLQVYGVVLAVINALIPPTPYWWADFLLIPWAVLAIFGFTLLSIVIAKPAFEKVQQASMRKAVMNNMRQIAAAAAQYFLENAVTRVAIAELIGPDKYLKQIVSVDGESYADLVLEPGKPIVVKLKSGEELSYAP